MQQSSRVHVKEKIVTSMVGIIPWPWSALPGTEGPAELVLGVTEKEKFINAEELPHSTVELAGGVEE